MLFPQAVPVQADLGPEVRETMVGCALSQNFELHEIPTHSDIRQVTPPGGAVFQKGEPLLHSLVTVIGPQNAWFARARIDSWNLRSVL